MVVIEQTRYSDFHPHKGTFSKERVKAAPCPSSLKTLTAFYGRRKGGPSQCECECACMRVRRKTSFFLSFFLPSPSPSRLQICSIHTQRVRSLPFPRGLCAPRGSARTASASLAAFLGRRREEGRGGKENSRKKEPGNGARVEGYL